MAEDVTLEITGIEANGDVTSSFGVVDKSIELASNLISCPHCPSTNKRFKGQIGLKTHIGRKHQDLKYVDLMGECENVNEIDDHVKSVQDLSTKLCFLKKNVIILKRIPRAARRTAALKLSSILESCCTHNDLKHWAILLTFVYSNFCLPVKKTKHSLATSIKKNLNSAIKDSLPYKKRNFKQSLLSTRIEAKVADGDIRGAVKILSSQDTLSPASEETLKKLMDKHPQCHRQFKCSNVEVENMSVCEEDVKLALSSFPNGSSGGMDGLRPQHLKDLTMTENGEAASILLSSLTKFCNFVFSGKVTESILPIFFGASLIALDKNDGGVRPIAVGCTLRRLVSKLACFSVREKMANYFVPHQLGFATSKGSEAIVHATRSFINDFGNKKKIVLKIDYKNAFNTVHRDIFLRAVRERAPEIYNLVWQAYGAPTNLYFSNKIILSAAGCQQGDPLGPLLFCLSLHENVVLKLQSDLVAFYLDDGIIAGNTDEVLSCFKIIVDESEKIGLTVNSSKCELFFCGDSESADISSFQNFAADIKIKKELTLLGAPISLNSLESLLFKKLDTLSILFQRIQELKSLHVGYFLLRYCLAIPKLLYLLRVSPSWMVLDFLNKCDLMIKETLEFLINNRLEDPIKYIRATLPVRFGGIGIRRVTDLCLPAFISSAFGSFELVNSLLSSISDKPNVSFLEEALAEWNKVNQDVPVQKSCQKEWDKINMEKIVSHLKLSSNIEKASFQALQAAESNVWLNAIPSKNLGTILDNNVFRISMGVRLCCRICLPHICVCGDFVDGLGLHGLHCIKSKGRYSRHQEINNIIHRALSSAQIHNHLEPPGLLRDDGKRVDGVTLIPWEKGRCLSWDVTCVDTFAPSYIENSVKSVGYAAKNAETNKRKKYCDIINQGIDFLPFAFETVGVWGADALDFIKKLGKRLNDITGEHRSKYYLMQRIGLAIQRGNAASIMGTFSPGTNFSEIFYLLDNKPNIRSAKPANVATIYNNTQCPVVQKNSENSQMKSSMLNNFSKSERCDSTNYKMGQFLSSYVIDVGASRLKPRGLVNKSNFCYLNSILQVLIACPPVYNLLSALAKNFPASTASEKRKLTVIDCLCLFVIEFQQLPADERVVTRSYKIQNKDVMNIKYDVPFEPTWMYKMLKDLNRGSFIIEGRQEDAEEFFECLLNGLNDEMQELMFLIDIQLTDVIKVDTKSVTDQFHLEGPKTNGSNTIQENSLEKTPINTIFGGLLKYKIHRGGHESTYNFQRFFSLQLKLEEVDTVEEALEALVSKNYLEGVTASKTYCEAEAWQEVVIEKLPIVLVLHLKCFDFTLKGCTKIMKALRYPIDLKIDSRILKSTCNSEEKHYRLFAVVYHEGKEVNRGHYLTDVFHEGYRRWIRYNDSSVNVVSEEHVLSSEVSSCRVPYLLFYRDVNVIR